jgi:multicomponent Na+:H+ antiporter subunit E
MSAPENPMTGSPPAGEHDRRTASHRLRDFVYLFAVLCVLWLMLTSSLNWQQLAAGAAVSLLLALFLSRTYAELGMPPLSLRRVRFMLAYLVILLVEIVKANLDVACRIVNPRLPIEPGIVVIRTALKHNIARMILANSITLTPGTFTLDIIGDQMLIHWIVVRETETARVTKEIGSRFERYLKEIFE